MDKKEFKMYVTPEQEIIEVELEGFLCGSTNAENATVEELGEEEEEG
jgi:hypothetical protein